MYATDAVAADIENFRRATQERQAYKPLYVKLKLIYGCNLKCEMCNHWRFHREQPLPHARLLSLLVELAALGCRKIHLTGGEPLLRGHVPELIAHATALGIRANMTTNGTLVDKEKAKALVEAGLRGVNVSLDSPQRKIHDRVRGVPGAWKKTTRAIEHFHRYAHKGKLMLRINTVVNSLTYESLLTLPDLAHELGADNLNLIAVDDHCGPSLSLSRRQIAEYNARIAPHIAARALALGLMTYEQEAYPFGRTEHEIKRAKYGQYAQGWYDRHPCFAPWTHTLIDYNGLVYVCCMTREQIEPLGNVQTQSFADIWRGSGYQVIRRMMHPPQLARCRRCDDFLEENRKLLDLVEGVNEGTSDTSRGKRENG
jgi:MoaA/NifB/PqqE/SkfB family radical SAM enzyme